MTVATDPWATAPTEAPAPSVTLPSDNPYEGVEISATFKEGVGFDASWNVVRAPSPAALKAVLNDPEYREVLELQWKISSHFRSGSTSGNSTASAPAQRSPQQAPAGAQQPPDWAPPMPDGYLYKTGAKNGSVWHAYWPIDSRSGLEKIWLNKPK